MSKKLVLIDGHSILNRAFFGIPDLTNAEGIHTNAVYGFLNILFKILEEEKPDYLTVAFDVHAPTFRHEMYAEYKGTRKPMAEELRQQVSLMKEMLTAMGVRIIEKAGYEADDLLGTLSKRGEEAGMEVSVVSGDRDLLQLATEHVKIRIPKTKRTGTEIEDYYAADVKERYLVTPIEFIDVKALMGDTSDNIPGVPGIGEKTATNLIAAYGSIENAYAHVEEIKPNRAKENLKEHYELAQLSKTLATIDVKAEIDYDFEEAILGDLYTPEAYVLCKRLEFKNMLAKFDVDAPKSNIEEHFCRVEDFTEAENYLEKAAKTGYAGLSYIEENGVLLGIGLCIGEEECAYLAVNGFLTEGYLKERLKSMISDGMIFSVLELKPIIKSLALTDLQPEKRNQFFDCEIGAYLLNPLQSEYPYEDVAKNYLDALIPSKADLLGKQTFIKAESEQPENFLKCVCYEAYTAWKAKAVLSEKLKETNMYSLYEEIELPLVYTLADMEIEGIAADREALKVYGENLVTRITELEQGIYEKQGKNSILILQNS